jgi:hypothetical protein
VRQVEDERQMIARVICLSIFFASDSSPPPPSEDFCTRLLVNYNFRFSVFIKGQVALLTEN